MSAVLTIDLGALVSNWSLLQHMAAPAECAAVVKADAYGLGVHRVVPALARAGCRTFFVAHASEGQKVREALGEDMPGYRIYILNGLSPSDAEGRSLTQFGLRPVLSTLEQVRHWRECSQRLEAGLPAALQIDTGMNRLGMAAEDIPALRDLIAGEPWPSGDEPPHPGNASQKMAQGRAVRTMPPGIYPDLVMSHFVAAEQPADQINLRQMADFRKIAAEFPAIPASLANSSGIFLPQKPFHELVRPGFALYGGNPVPGLPNPMRSVVSLEAEIIQTQWVKPGATVGYNARWSAPRRSHLATLGVGYADGFPFHAGHATGNSDKAFAMVLGQPCPIVGRVSMDLIVLDATSLPGDAVRPGLTAQLLGPDISVDDLAARSGTIGYAVLTGLGKRYRRVYRG